MRHLLWWSLAACRVEDDPCGYDVDRDGTPACDDCADLDPAIHPGAGETCDGVDQDCDGGVDEGARDAMDFYGDADGDGVGAGAPTRVCIAPAGSVPRGGDCDDGDADAFPGNAERCDGVDQDCDAAVDEDAVDAPQWFRDVDGDGWGGGMSLWACASPEGWVADAGDCDDAVTDVYPGAHEACGEEADCDGAPRVCALAGELLATSTADAWIDATPHRFVGRGTWVLDARDVDGDGARELVIGASNFIVDPIISGAAQVVRGDVLTRGAHLVLADVVDAAWFGGSRDAFGSAVAWAGDGDDALLVVGSPGSGNMPGHVDVHQGGWAGGDDVATTFVGKGTASLGHGVGAGDPNADGFADVLFSNTDEVAYGVTFGPFAGGSRTWGDVDLVIDGGGEVVVSDVTGDGAEDVVFGRPTEDGVAERGGLVVVCAGPLVAGHLELEDADAFVYGASWIEQTGSLGDPTDLDGDGYVDLVSQSSKWPGRADDRPTGAVHVSAGPLAGAVTTDDAAWRFTGRWNHSGRFGSGHSVAPDLDGNGDPDLVIPVESWDDPNDDLGGGIGAVFVYYGAPAPGVYSHEDADVSILGDHKDAAFGYGLANLGDLDGDGADELLVASDGPTDDMVSGRFFVFFGAP